MTTAISVAPKHGAKAVICASTGNTSASAAAYATKAGMACAVLVPDGKIAMGKLSQAVAHGATLLQVEGNFDDCLTVARKLAEAYPVELVNSVNPARIEGQKTAAFEVVDALGDAPDIHCLPVGNAGNITAYWQGYREYAAGTPGAVGDAGTGGPATRLPQMWGFQAAGAAPIVLGHPVDDAGDDRDRDPDRQPGLVGPGCGRARRLGRADRRGDRRADPPGPPDPLGRRGLRRARVGGERSPGCSSAAEAGDVPAGARIVCTVTGHGLKDPQWALRSAPTAARSPRPGSAPRRMPPPSPLAWSADPPDA
jgi:threonine synthase